MNILFPFPLPPWMVQPAGELFFLRYCRVWIILVSLLFLSPPVPYAFGDDSLAPLAGQPFDTTLMGQEIHIPSRDRRHVTAVNVGVQWIPDGPRQLKILPLGALFIWHNWTNENRLFRGTFSAVYNDLRYQRGLTSTSPWFAVITFENFILPLGRAEYVEGQRIRDETLAWSYLFGGIGFGYRTSLSPWHQDNAFELSFTYEPGFRWFDRTSKTGGNFIVPNNTYEGRAHVRLRVDRLERNLMELLHQGVAFGGDVLYGHRTSWRRWSGIFHTPDTSKEPAYLAASFYAAIADRVPFLQNERHRWVGTFHGGIGKDLDRFSTFRLPGRPTGYEWEALSRPLIPGVAFNELFPRKYAIANFTYRYEALFFLYPYIRGTWSAIELPRFRENGSIKFQVDMLPALGAGVVSGAPWSSQIEANYSYNFGIFRDRQGPQKGGHGIMVFWSKLL
jgi:hypothetical protein